MTDDMMNLRTLLEKSADADLLREMIGFAAERLMELDVEGLTGAAHGARDPERLTHRRRSHDRRAATLPEPDTTRPRPTDPQSRPPAARRDADPPAYASLAARLRAASSQT